MRAYGKKRRDCANRKIRGTSIACPCCIPKKAHFGRKAARKAARREARATIEQVIVPR